MRTKRSRAGTGGSVTLGILSFHSPWIYTMNRCVTSSPRTPARRRRLVLALACCAGLGASLASSTVSAQMQFHRRFPIAALRGTITFSSPPDVVLNKTATRLSPGIRIHDLNNMLVLFGQLAGSKYTVDYTLEPSTGDLQEIWILSDTEKAVTPWPRTAAEAAAWTFDYMAQTWTKP